VRRAARSHIGRARARARANIALAKYWGKCDDALNLPAVPSISLTLDRLSTVTEVCFDRALNNDLVAIDGVVVSGRPRDRVVTMLDRVRARAGLEARARVTSRNAFPTAAGLASSASGFAALAAAASTAAGLSLPPRELSRLARLSSASAARSIFGGFAELPAGRAGNGALAARALFGVDHWDVRLVVALTTLAPKDVGSTEAMERSRRTSPLYAAWLEEAPRLARRIRRALSDRDLSRLGPAMERSTLAFHACAMTSSPSVLYWQPATVALLHAVRRLREEKNVQAFATMDAGPNVKVLCHSGDAATVARALRRAPGALRVITCAPGAGVEELP